MSKKIFTKEFRERMISSYFDVPSLRHQKYRELEYNKLIILEQISQRLNRIADALEGQRR